LGQRVSGSAALRDLAPIPLEVLVASSTSDLALLVDGRARCVGVIWRDPELALGCPEPLEGRALADIVAARAPAELCAEVRRAVGSGTPVRAEIAVRGADGERWLAIVVTPVGGDDVLWIARDVTEVRAVAAAPRRARTIEENRRAELERANARLVELDGLRSKFVSDVSHELRAPVTNMLLTLSLLERAEPGRAAHYVRVVRQQAARLGTLIEDVLDLARLELGGEEADFVAVDLNALTEQVVSAHQPRAEAAGLVLAVDLEPGLPAVRALPGRLSQVVANLVSNALQYTPLGTVCVRTRQDGRRVGLEVEDTGIGIAPDDRPRLFERFFRGRHDAGAEIPGTGLGLAIVEEIVALHQGKIEVESEPGEGSTFRVWLPLAQVDRASGR